MVSSRSKQYSKTKKVQTHVIRHRFFVVEQQFIHEWTWSWIHFISLWVRQSGETMRSIEKSMWITLWINGSRSSISDSHQTHASILQIAMPPSFNDSADWGAGFIQTHRNLNGLWRKAKVKRQDEVFQSSSKRPASVHKNDRQEGRGDRAYPKPTARSTVNHLNNHTTQFHVTE